MRLVNIVYAMCRIICYLAACKMVDIKTIITIISSTVAIAIGVSSTISVNGQEACETLTSDIHITKDEFDELGRLVRTCSGDVTVNKCEGACNSQVQPSVITPSGFLKECYCCRESFLRERAIILSHCYDPDGVRFSTEKLAEMEVKLREPANCKCYKCGNSPI